MINFYAKNPTKVISALSTIDEASSKQLAAITKLHRGTVTRILKDLRDAQMIHISRWEVNHTTMPTCFYKWGSGADKREPIYIPKSHTTALHESMLSWPRADIAAAWLRNPI